MDGSDHVPAESPMGLLGFHSGVACAPALLAFISNKDWSRLLIFSLSLPSRPWADTAVGRESSMLANRAARMSEGGGRLRLLLRMMMLLSMGHEGLKVALLK
jgi:hypothetical protein